MLAMSFNGVTSRPARSSVRELPVSCCRRQPPCGRSSSTTSPSTAYATPFPGHTTQSSSPLSYVVRADEIVGVQWEQALGQVALVTRSGEVIRGKGSGAARAAVTVRPMPRDKKRKKAVVYSRPGNRRKADRVDPAAGLEDYFPGLQWVQVSDGAWLAIIKVNETGNTVACCRLSGEDSNETLVTQVDGILALAERQSELDIRYWILAVDMSGTREVRQRPEMPFPPGTAERDDMNRLDLLLNEGWIEHIVFLTDDRIARDIVSALLLIRRWRNCGARLWLSTHGGEIDIRDDEPLISILCLTSANERTRLTRRLRMGAMRKGPMANKGHLSSTPHAFRRDEIKMLEEDEEVWPWILRIFELADIGLADGVGLSEREIAAALTAEGYPIDHDRVRTLLQDPIYATGEWTVNINGIPVAQAPIKLKWPVPMDRFQRVQDWFALRQGAASNTPLGEVLFNYVECVHAQCAGSRTEDDLPIRIRAYYKSANSGTNTNWLKLRHVPKVPPQCKCSTGRGQAGGWTWPKDALERPVVEELRRLVSNPDLLAAASVFEEHTVASTSARLTAKQRRDLEDETDLLEEKLESASQQWIDKHGATGNFEAFERFTAGLSNRINANSRRLATRILR